MKNTLRLISNKTKKRKLLHIQNDLYFARGQSLFEVVVAVGLSALILAGVVSLSAGSVRTSSFSQNNAQATKLAQEAMEWLRSQRDAGWASFRDDHSGTSNLCLSPIGWGGSCPIPGTIFNRSVTLSVLDSDRVDAIVIVTWKDAQGTHEVKTQTRFTSWR